MENQFLRTETLIGKDALQKLAKSKIAVFGIGGVGGYVVEALARAGIGHLDLIDNDIINYTNINRQIIALNSNIGKYKVDVAKERVLDINDKCNIKTICKFIDEDNILELFDYKIDYVIDCCDTVSTKALVIKECLDRNIKFISCMGTGNKFHPEMLEIIELKKTSYDSLARIMRNKFKNEKRKIMVVCSKEKAVSIPDRTPGSTSIVPNAAGILCASFVINDILKEL